MDTLEFLKNNCILRRKDGIPLFSREGTTFSWALDIRKALLNPLVLTEFAQAFLEKYKDHEPYQLASVETSGIPLMTAIQILALETGTEINGVIVRKKRKKHLQQAHIDGLDLGIKTIVLDDSVNSGRSILNAVVKLRDAGFKVTDCFFVVSFESTSKITSFEKHSLMSEYLYSLSDFDIDFRRGYVPKTKYNVSWTFASPDPKLNFAVAKSKPVIYKKTIMFGSDCGTFWCLDKNTGRIKWFFGTNDKTGKGIISSAVIDEGRVYFGSYDGTLYCLNADTGSVVWANPCCNWIGSSPLIVEDILYIGLEYKTDENKGAMAAFNKHTGEGLWVIPTKITLHGSPAYNEKNHAVVWGTNDGTVAVIDIKKQAVRKYFRDIGAVKYAPATVGDLAVFGSFDGNIYVWDFVQDKVMFSYHTDDIVYSTPLIVGNRAYMGSADHQFVVINLENFTLVKAFDVGEKVHSSPVLIDGIVYFGTSKGELLGILPHTLQTAVEYQFPERLTNAIVSDGKHLFVYSFDNKMWAISHG